MQLYTVKATMKWVRSTIQGKKNTNALDSDDFQYIIFFFAGVAESSNFHFLFLTDEYEDCFGNSTSELVRKVEELILHMSGSHPQLKIGWLSAIILKS